MAMSIIASLSSSTSWGARSISCDIVARRERKPGLPYWKPLTHLSTRSLARSSFLSEAVIMIETACFAASAGLPWRAKLVRA